MIVTKIELSNFRNYDSLSLELDDKTNILYGKNAQGKTNVLEAIYLCSTTKSHRSSKDAELIKFENNEGHIKLFINKKGREYRIDIHLRKNKSKGIAINGIPIKKASELFGIFNVIFFSKLIQTKNIICTISSLNYFTVQQEALHKCSCSHHL